MLKSLLFAVLLLPISAPGQLLSDLRAYYTFESQTAGTSPNVAHSLGSAGFANDGARLQGGEPIVGGVVPLSSDPGTFRAGTAALACDGALDYADLAVCPVVTNADFTVAVWFKPQTNGGLTGSVRAFVIETKPAFSISFGLRAGATGTTNFQLFTDIVTGTDPSANFNLPNAEVDEWHHFVFRYTVADNTVQGYLDGVLRHQLVLSTALSNVTGFNTGTYRTADTRWFKGFIDEEVFWQRALSQAEITALFDGGSANKTFAVISGEPANQVLRTGLTAYYGFDSHTNRFVANSAVALGAPGFAGDSAELKGDYTGGDGVVHPLTNDPAQARAGHGALLCDGINNYVAISGNPVDQNQSWTISVWFKPQTDGQGYAGAATRAFIYETGTNFPISFGLRGSTNPEAANFQMFTQFTNTNSKFQDHDVPITQLDQWHHFIETYDSSTGVLTGYLDGVQTHSLNDDIGGTRVPLQNYTGFRLGTYRAADGRWFKGLIDEVAMWQRALTAGEASLVYGFGSSGVPLSESGTDLRITGFSRAASGGGYEISWATTPGLNYTLEASSDLIDWSTELLSEVPASDSSMTFGISATFPPRPGELFDPGLAGSPKRFYRVRLKL